MNALLRRLTRIGLRRGLSGEHWAWLLLAGAAFLLRRTRQVEGPTTTIELAPGERYLVSLADAGGRNRRRDGRRRGGGTASLGDVVTAALDGGGGNGGRVTTGPAASAD